VQLAGCDRLPLKGVLGKRPAVFVRLSDAPIPRVQRMMLVAKELGFEPYFIGSFRQAGLTRRAIIEGWQVERIGPHFPLLNGTRPLYYVASILRYWAALFTRLRQIRPSLLHVSDFEVFWPARLYAVLNGIPILYNIHDNLSLRYKCSRATGAILNILEGLAVFSATVTIVPEEFRKSALPRWARRKVRVVRNTPVDPGYKPPHKPGSDPVTILYAGWLDEGRGLRKLIELVAREPKLLLRVAGNGDPALVQAAKEARNTEFRGYLSHREVMEQTAASDFVAALYDPRRAINRYAASNKIAEALAVGRPVIVNRELRISALLETYDCAVFIDYAHAADVGSMLSSLRSDAIRYEQMCLSARKAYEENYSWENVRLSSHSVFLAAERAFQ